MSNIDLTPSTIKQLQDYMAAKIEKRGFADETLHERLVLLMEEVGEEITDVMNMLFAVGIVLDIDIEKEFLAKEHKNDQRTYKHSEEKM